MEVRLDARVSYGSESSRVRSGDQQINGQEAHGIASCHVAFLGLATEK